MEYGVYSFFFKNNAGRFGKISGGLRDRGLLATCPQFCDAVRAQPFCQPAENPQVNKTGGFA